MEGISGNVFWFCCYWQDNLARFIRDIDITATFHRSCFYIIVKRAAEIMNGSRETVTERNHVYEDCGQ